jgi:hypothetical protein
MIPDSGRRDDGEVPPSPRCGNEEGGVMTPHPIGERHRGQSPDLLVENPTDHGTSPSSQRNPVKYSG